MADRSRRKRKERPTIASNIHYVGYVEDEESVEAIMKKFEELERIQKEIASTSTSARCNSSENKENEPSIPNIRDTIDDSKSSPAALPPSSPQSQGFTEAQLEEVFRRTSAFTVKSAVMDEVYVDELDELELWQQAEDGNMDEFLEEDDYIAVDDDFWEMEFGDSPRGSKRSRRPSKAVVHTGGVRRGGTDRESIIARYRIAQVRLQDAKGNYFTVKKKVSTLDPSLPTYVKIPPTPIPRSWVHTILSLEVTEKPVPGSRYFETDILSMNLTKLGTQFQAVYMDPPLLLPGEVPSPGKITIEQLKTLRIPSVVPKGFLFVWLEKEHLPAIVRMADGWGFKYVENFCWIQKRVNNGISKREYRYFNKSKLSCLIFRKEGDVELRHQRNPDCVFDYVKPRREGELTEDKPPFVYDVIETMLPQAVYSAENPNGERMLELWAKKGSKRKGWTTVVQKLEDN